MQKPTETHIVCTGLSVTDLLVVQALQANQLHLDLRVNPARGILQYAQTVL